MWRGRDAQKLVGPGFLSLMLPHPLLEDTFDRYLARWGSVDRMRLAM
jgi:hypothetical protein